MAGSGKKKKTDKKKDKSSPDKEETAIIELQPLDNRKFKKDRKRKSTNSPRKTSRSNNKTPKKEENIVFNISAVDLAEAGPSRVNNVNESEVKCRKVVIKPPEGHEVEGTAVSFHEDNDEYVEMHVNEDDFECMEEDNFIDQMVEDEIDWEVSFNNNATARSMTVTYPPPEELMKKGGGSKGETEEEKEMRIVNKTVAKLKEFMTAGNYLKQDVTRQVIIPKTSTGKSPKRSSTIKQGGVLNPRESVSESTIYQNAVQPVERPRQDIKLLVHEEKDTGSIFTTQAVKDALELLRVSNYSSSNVSPSNLMMNQLIPVVNQIYKNKSICI